MNRFAGRLLPALPIRRPRWTAHGVFGIATAATAWFTTAIPTPASRKVPNAGRPSFAQGKPLQRFPVLGASGIVIVWKVMSKKVTRIVVFLLEELQRVGRRSSVHLNRPSRPVVTIALGASGIVIAMLDLSMILILRLVSPKARFVGPILCVLSTRHPKQNALGVFGTVNVNVVLYVMVRQISVSRQLSR